MTMLNDRFHEVCGDCGSIVGHGCPTAEHCDCDDDEETNPDEETERSE